MTDEDLGRRFLTARRDLRRARGEAAAHQNTVYKLCEQLANAGRKAIIQQTSNEAPGFRWSNGKMVSVQCDGEIGKWPSYGTVAEEVKLLDLARQEIKRLESIVNDMEEAATDLIDPITDQP